MNWDAVNLTSEYWVYDLARVFKVVLAFIVLAIVLRFAYDQVKNRGIRTPRFFIFLGLASFTASTAFNAAYQVGEPPTARFFLNYVGIISILVATRMEIKMPQEERELYLSKQSQDAKTIT